jgi:hypothetical protein
LDFVRSWCPPWSLQGHEPPSRPQRVGRCWGLTCLVTPS